MKIIFLLFVSLLGFNNMKWLTEKEVQKLKEVWASASREEIRKIFPDRRYASLSQRARKLGLKSEIHKNSKGNVAPLLNESCEAYYWLGFIMADGYLSKQNGISVLISERDKIHLQKLARFLKTKVKLRKRQDGGSYNYKTGIALITVGDSVLVPEIRKKFSLKHTNKTYNPPILPEMKREQFLSFLAGYIDGDGCIAKQGNCGKYKREDVVIQVKCHSSWLDLLCEMEEKLYKELGFCLERNHVRINKQGYTFWRVSNNKVIRKFKSELLDLNLPIMKRKWDKIIL